MGSSWGSAGRRSGEGSGGVSLLEQRGEPAAAEGGAGDDVPRACDGPSPEEKASYFGKLLFFWAFPVVWNGYRRGRTDLEDLPPLPNSEQPELMGQRLIDAWHSQLRRQGAEHPARLPRLLRTLYKGIWLQALGLQAMVWLAQYMQPILLHRLLKQFGHEDSGSSLVLDALAIAFAVMVQWIFAEYAWVQFVKADLRLRAGLVHLIYRKALYLPATGSGFTLGELQTLFASDATKPTQNFITAAFVGLIEAVVTVSVVGWHLTMLAGSAGWVAMVVIAAFCPVHFFVVRFMKRMTINVMAARTRRGRIFNEFLSAMRVVKCFQLEDIALSQITQARNLELYWQWRRRIMFPINQFIANSSSLFGTAACFTWLLLVLDRPSDPALAFTVLSWNNLLKASLYTVPNNCIQIIDMYVSLRRIERLLHADLGEAWLEPLATLEAIVNPPIENAEKEQPTPAAAPVFELSHCDVGYPLEGGQHRGIHDLSLRVEKGELVLICGPIGCGKSVLLEGLVGVRQPLAGGLAAPGSQQAGVAYTAQRPWLLNGTILDNILFGKPYQEEKLQRVVACCCLQPDLQSLEDGIHTRVGEEGVQLSGGQKHRVCLARAVYSGADVVLMDDVLSALDAHVSNKVWEDVICGELKGRTLVLATSQVQYCSHPNVSQILILNREGSVQHLGSYAQLCAEGVDFGLVQPPSSEEANVEDGPNGESGSQQQSPMSPAPIATGRNGRGGDADPTAEFRRLGALKTEDVRAFLTACGGCRGPGLTGLMMVCYYGSLLVSNLQLAAWSNADKSHSEAGHSASDSGSKKYLMVYLLLALCTGVSAFLMFVIIQLVSLRCSRVMHEQFTRGLLWARLRFFDITPTGRALNRCLKDFQVVDDTLPAAMRMLAESVANMLLALGILLSFAWEALLAVPVFAPIYWVIMNIYRWPARDTKRLEAVARSPVMSHFADSSRGTSTIRAFRHDGRFMRCNLTLMGDIQRTSYWYTVTQGWVSLVQEVLGTLLLAIVAGTVGYRASTGSLSAGLAGLCLSYAISMPRDLMWFSRRWANLEVEFVSVERLLEYVRLPLELELEPLEGGGAEPAASGGGPAQGPDEAMAISAEAVWFRYDGELPWVLRGLSLQVPCGARAAVVGRTGCGKSSFLSAVMRLYPVGEGCLRVHGRDVGRTPLRELRSAVRVLLQDPIFFTGSIRSNLLCHTPTEGLAAASSGEDAALWGALAQAGLESLVQRLPQGLDEKVEEGGQNFSHGERQLLCLARVLLETPGDAGGTAGRVLLCDEPTSACDLATDERIHHTLLHRLPEAWTLAVVCHRLHRIRNFSHVYVLEAGRVIEQGAPGELLLAAGGGGAGAAAAGSPLLAMCRKQGVA